MATTNNVNQDFIVSGDVGFYYKAHAVRGTGITDPVIGNVVDWTTNSFSQLGSQTEGGGVVMEYAGEFFPKKSNMQNTAFDMILTGEELTLRLTCEETELDQVGLGIAGSTYAEGAVAGTNPNTLMIGEPAATSLYSIGFEGVGSIGPIGVGGTAPHQTTKSGIVGFFPMAQPMGSVVLDHNRFGNRIVAYEFKVLNDVNSAVGAKLGTLYEITVVA